MKFGEPVDPIEVKMPYLSP